MKNKILCLTDGFTLGGAERQLIGLAYLLKQKNYDVDLACYYEKNFYKELIQEYKLNCITLNATSKIQKIFAVKKLVKSRNYSTIIAYKDGATIIACFLKLLGTRCKVIVSERNTTQTFNRRERFKFQMYRFADVIVPNSYSQEKVIIAQYPHFKDKVCTITNFTDINTFSPSVAQEPNKKITIVIAGRISQQKNILRFLDALIIIREHGVPVFFKWFGNGRKAEAGYEAEVLSKWKENHLADIISFLPATSTIKDEYQKCDAFCLPSLFEGYPNVVCEAMSCGVPVLCSRVCDNPFIVEDNKNGFMFDPLDVNDIVEKIETFVYLPVKQRTIMGKEGRKIAEIKFSEEAFVQKYINLLRITDGK